MRFYLIIHSAAIIISAILVEIELNSEISLVSVIF